MSMDRVRHLERDLPGLFEEVAEARTPDYLEAAIERASSTSQRPAWTFPTRWLPIEVVATRVPTTRLPWRQIGVLALIAVIIATLLALVVGSHTTRLPPPFGPAANGVVALARNGDLYTVDPATGEMRLVLGGPENDQWVGFTPDGTRGVFVRQNALGRVGTIPLGGGAQPTMVQKDVLRGEERFQVAPDGQSVAFAGDSLVGTVIGFSDDTGGDWYANNISVARFDQGSLTTFAEPVTDYGGIAYLAPDGREIVCLTRSSNRRTHDISAIDVKSGVPRKVVKTSVGNDIFGNVSAAPDGRHIAYALKSANGTVNVHVVDVDGKGDHVVAHAAGATYEASPQWDPQGRRLLIERVAGDGVIRPVIVDLAGGTDVVIDAEISDKGAVEAWSPDGTSILARPTDADGQPMQQELWDARTGKVTPVSWSSVTPPAWQRTAP